MEHTYIKVYSECVELSKKSTFDSLKELMEIYLNSNKEIQKTARTALKKTKNKNIVYELINTQLETDIDGEKRVLLLSLGYSMSRYKYIGKYIYELRKMGINLKSNGFLKGLSTNPLSIAEKKKLAEYIIEFRDFDSALFNYANCEETRELIYSALIDSVLENGVTDEKINLIKSNRDCLELLQNELLTAIKKNPKEKISYAKFLDFSMEKNMELLTQYEDLVTVYGILRNNLFLDEILYADDLNVVSALAIIRGTNIEEKNWELVKQEIEKYILLINNVEDYEDLLLLIVGTNRYDAKFAEEKLIGIYKESKLYSDLALEYLIKIKSSYAYREMLSFMLTSENRKERVKYAVELVKKYPENAATVYLYAKELNDDNLIATLEEVANKFNVEISFKEKYADILLDSKNQLQIISQGTVVSELLFDLAKEIGANKFYAAVGFTFQSGLRMLYPLINYINNNSGKIELITGSLQGFMGGNKTTKIDKSTVKFLNSLCEDKNFSLFTHTDRFYHGKYYYLASDEKAYVVIGSSNISKTAFLDNYELDVLVELNTIDGTNQFVKWYENFRSQCIAIEELDENIYSDFKWESELEIYNTKVVKRMSNYEIGKKIDELSDEETKFRLNAWMNHLPAEIYSDLGIASLQEYIVLLYPNRGLAVFESFVPENAYYIFKYYDFDILLENVSKLTKTQMIATSSFLNRGYHITDRIRLGQKIDELFI